MLGSYPLGEAPVLESKLRKLYGLPFSEPTGGLLLARKPSIAGEQDLLLGVGSSEILKAVADFWVNAGC